MRSGARTLLYFRLPEDRCGTLKHSQVIQRCPLPSKITPYPCLRSSEQWSKNFREWVTNGDELDQFAEDVPQPVQQIQWLDGRHVGTRTPDLYRVKVAL